MKNWPFLKQDFNKKLKQKRVFWSRTQGNFHNKPYLPCLFSNHFCWAICRLKSSLWLFAPLEMDPKLFSSIESAQEKVPNSEEPHSQALHKSFLYRQKQNCPDNSASSFPHAIPPQHNSNWTQILAADSIIIYQISYMKTIFDPPGSTSPKGHGVNGNPGGTGSSPEQCSVWNNIQRVSPVLIIQYCFRAHQ